MATQPKPPLQEWIERAQEGRTKSMDEAHDVTGSIVGRLAGKLSGDPKRAQDGTVSTTESGDTISANHELTIKMHDQDGTVWTCKIALTCKVNSGEGRSQLLGPQKNVLAEWAIGTADKDQIFDQVYKVAEGDVPRILGHLKGLVYTLSSAPTAPLPAGRRARR